MNHEPQKIGQVISLSSRTTTSQTCQKHQIEMVCSTFAGKEVVYCPQCAEEEQKAQMQAEIDNIRKEAEEAAKAKTARQFEAIQIGRRFMGCAWEDYQPPCKEAETAKRFCRYFAHEFGRAKEKGISFIMAGKPGTGKNMLAALIAKDVVGQGHTALHTTASKLIRKIRATWRDRNQDEQEAINAFVRPDLLIIDEVGIQAGSETEERLLTEVINDRYEAMKPTICISNLSANELEKYLGYRILDRFHENGGRVLVFNWESWRRH